MKILFYSIAAAVGALIPLVAGELLADTFTRALTITANVASQAKITLGVSNVTFVDFYHEHRNTVPANENPVAISAKAKTQTGSTVNLTFLADDDLKSGNHKIAISNVSWTAGGSGFQGGTRSKSSPQTVGTWTGSGSRSGTLSFFFDNQGQHSTGDYTSYGTFTLSAP